MHELAWNRKLVTSQFNLRLFNLASNGFLNFFFMHEFLFGINFAKVVLYIVNLTHQVQLSPNKMQDMFVCGIFSIRNVLLFLWTFLFVRKILRGYESVIWKCNCCCIQKFLGSSFQQICHELNGLQSPVRHSSGNH